MDIGLKIKELRLQKGYTLEELGNMVGVGKSTIRKWETGMIANMKRDKIAALAKALGVTPDYFIDYDKYSESSARLVSVLRNNKGLQALAEESQKISNALPSETLEKLAKLSDENKKAIATMIDALSRNN